jgi:hypothetical protein
VNKISLKGKYEYIVPVYTMKVYRMRSLIALILCTRWKKGLTSHSGLYTPGEESRYSLNSGLGGPQGRTGLLGKEKNISPLKEFEHKSSSQ